jgi:hypothetical protein
MDHKTKMERNIDQVLGLIDNLPDGSDSLPPLERTPMEIVEYTPVKTHIAVTEEITGEEADRLDDYNFSRTIMRGLIEKGISALELSMLLAKESENPRTFDTIVSLIGTISKANTDLMSLHNKKGTAKAVQTADVINNNTQIINQPANTAQNNETDINNLLDGLVDVKDK